MKKDAKRRAAWLVAIVCLGPVRLASAETVAVKATRIFVGDGRVIEDGIVLISNGRIQKVGSKLRVPEGIPYIQLDGGCLTPGLIDANARIGAKDLIAPLDESGGYEPEHGADSQSDASWERVQQDDALSAEEERFPTAAGVSSREIVNEQSSEVVPHIRVLDAIDLRSGDFDRLIRGGVTTVYASPDASAVIGARGAVLHTAGPRSRRVLVPAAAVKATIGMDPTVLGAYNTRPSRTSLSMYARRPNSRMGLEWVFRKAFYDAQRLRDGLPVYGADTAEPEALEVIQQILDGDVPLRIQARIQRDISTALRLAAEFELSFTLEEATEAHLCIDELRRARIPVIFGPIYERPTGIRAATGEGRDARLYTFRSLLRAGIVTALSAQELRDEEGLARQAMYAQRMGVSFDDALRAVTCTPARLLGLEDQLGAVKPGKRADLVLWDGTPFAATSRPVVVLVDGQIIVDKREQSGS